MRASRVGPWPSRAGALLGADARTARAQAVAVHNVLDGLRAERTRRSLVGERDDLAPEVLERVGLAGYGGITLLLVGRILGGPEGQVLAGVGIATTLAGALLFFILLLATRPWQ